MTTKHFAVNQKYLTNEFLQTFRRNYSPSANNWSSAPGIRSTQELVDAIEAEVHRFSFKHNENDLFSFNQSVDISTLQSASHPAADFPLLKEFRSFMLSEVLPWMKTITGAPLDDKKIDLTSSIYRQADVLLCHDDELEGRRIAFTWYLVSDDWDAKVDGGCLQLFNCKKTHKRPSEETASELADEPLVPWNVAASLPPKRNMLAFFEVSNLSYHQVTEILGDKARVSLHGWFHGPPLRIHPFTNQCTSKPSFISPVFVEEELIYSWLNPIYLDMKEQAKIRRRFKRTSEIQLAHFLKADKWIILARQLAHFPESSWCFCGPMNRKHHGVLASSTAHADGTGSELLRQLHRLFTSEAMQVILSDLTGVELHPMSSCGETVKNIQDSQPPPVKRAHIEAETTVAGQLSISSEPAQLSDPQVRRWQPGNYTLLADTDVGSGSRWRLETCLHITGYGGQTGKEGNLRNEATNGDGWLPSWGGQLIYIASGEEGELLTVHPKDNCLTLVYTGPGTASFVKYINHAAVPQAPPPSSPESSATGDDLVAVAAFDLSVTFYEPGGIDHSDDDDSVHDLENEESDEGKDVETDSEDSTDNSQQ